MKQSDHVVAATACDLAGDIVRSFGKIRLRVVGTSMVPSILPGDTLSVQRAAASEICSGDIVVYSREGRLIAHRVVGATSGSEETLLITRGDRLQYDDPAVTSTELIGRVTSIQCADLPHADTCEIRPIELPAQSAGLGSLMLGVLRASDRATYLYLWLASFWRELFSRRLTCRA